MISLLRPKGFPEKPSPADFSFNVPSLSLAQEHYRQNELKGDPAASTIIRLTPDVWAEHEEYARAAINKSDIHFTKQSDKDYRIDESTISQFYKLALEFLDRKDIEIANLFFAYCNFISTDDDDRIASLSAMSYCSVYIDQYDDAFILAKECLNIQLTYPYAHCIAGLCELQNGNRKAAQKTLAIAARIARSNADYIEILQAAQRLLLILHFDK